MMHFKGCPCSVCNQPFQNDDDIVVCPICGTPYHRACYAQEGHCAYEDCHDEGYEYHPPATAGSGNRCGNCGADNPAGNLFCENCGTPLGERNGAQAGQSQPQRVQPQQISVSKMALKGDAARGNGSEQAFQGMFDAASIGREYDGISSADWMRYIGKSAQYYMFQFARMDESGRKTSICWSGLFFAPLYFAYRKMWSWTLLSAFASIALSIPSFLTMLLTVGVDVGFTLSMSTLNALMLVSMVLRWLMQIFFGVYSFYLFRQHGAKQIRALRERLAGGEAQGYHDALVRAGGTSTVAVTIVCLLSIIASYVFIFWVGIDKVMAFYNTLNY